VDDKTDTATFCRDNKINVACNKPVFELVDIVNRFIASVPKKKNVKKELLSAIGL
jgi:hypothetical protein